LIDAIFVRSILGTELLEKPQEKVSSLNGQIAKANGFPSFVNIWGFQHLQQVPMPWGESRPSLPVTFTSLSHHCHMAFRFPHSNMKDYDS